MYCIFNKNTNNKQKMKIQSIKKWNFCENGGKSKKGKFCILKMVFHNTEKKHLSKTTSVGRRQLHNFPKLWKIFYNFSSLGKLLHFTIFPFDSSTPKTIKINEIL